MANGDDGDAGVTVKQCWAVVFDDVMWQHVMVVVGGGGISVCGIW